MAMPSPAVTTLCWKSWARGARPIFLPSNTCDYPVYPCSVRDVAHEGHDWMATFMFFTPEWQHCNGVSVEKGETDATTNSR